MIRFAQPDPLQPHGYRLLVQSLDHATEAEFRAWVARVFGEAKGKACRIVAGYRGAPNGNRTNWEKRWVWRKDGWRAYLPGGE